jgi:alcohol dehydrogenase class IV
VAAFNAASACRAFTPAARALGVAEPDAVGPALFELAARLQAPTSLAELGLDHDAIPEVAKIIAADPVASPRDYTEENVVVLVEQAYRGMKPMPERN